MKDLKTKRLLAGLTQEQMAEQFEIPLSTIRKWEQGARSCPEYVSKMLSEKLDELHWKTIKLGIVGEENGSIILARMDGIYKQIHDYKLQSDFRNGGAGTIIYDKTRTIFISNTHGINGIYEKIAKGLEFKKSQFMYELEKIKDFESLLNTLKENGVDTDTFSLRLLPRDNNLHTVHVWFNLPIEFYEIEANDFADKDYYENLKTYYSLVNRYNERGMVEKVPNRFLVTSNIQSDDEITREILREKGLVDVLKGRLFKIEFAD